MGGSPLPSCLGRGFTPSVTKEGWVNMSQEFTDEMLWWDCSDQQKIDELKEIVRKDWFWSIDNPVGGNAQMTGDPNTDLVTLIENHFGEYADRILAQWANTFWSLLDQFGAMGAFLTILAYENPTNKFILGMEDRTFESILESEDPTNQK